MEHLKDYTADQLATIALKDLNTIQTNISKAIVLRKNMERKAWLDKLKTLVKDSGFSLEELGVDIKMPNEDKVAKIKAQPLYRNPDNPEQTWSGMGAKKKWLKHALEAGRRLDEFLVSNHP